MIQRVEKMDTKCLLIHNRGRVGKKKRKTHSRHERCRIPKESLGIFFSSKPYLKFSREKQKIHLSGTHISVRLVLLFACITQLQRRGKATACFCRSNRKMENNQRDVLRSTHTMQSCWSLQDICFLFSSSFHQSYSGRHITHNRVQFWN